MQWARFTKRLTALSPISILLITVCFAGTIYAQDADAKFLPGPELVLSTNAIAAGIDGVYRAILSIDRAGNVADVRLFGEPAWPCNTSPKRELAELRKAVEQHLKTIKFSPAMKDGKAHAADVTLNFAVGDAFKRAVAVGDAKKDQSSKIVRGGILNGRAIRMVKPMGINGARGIAVVQVLIDEQGNVAKAGLLSGDPLWSSVLREAACASKFSPPTIGGRPIQVTGVINYEFFR